MAKVYMRWLKQFSTFCTQAKAAFPDVSAAEVAIFLEQLAQKGLSASSINQASSAMFWAAQVSGRSDPTKDKIVTSILASARRRGEEVSKTPAGTKEHLLFLYEWAQERNTFVADRTFIISLACIHCCTRYDDITNARQADLVIGMDRVTLVQHKSKTDQ